MIALGALVAASMAFVPLDDRPVTAQLPVMLGRIAGVPVATPPPARLGRYLVPGNPDGIVAWLNADPAATKADAYVVSADMLAYGGLVASRIPDTAYAAGYYRLMEFRHLRQRHPGAWIGAFGTIMRLAPTGVPANVKFFAAYPGWKYLQQYANLHDPPLPAEAAEAVRLRAAAGEDLIDAYLAARTRDFGADRLLIDLTARGAIDRLVLGQDDAGPVGLHVPEVAALHAYAAGEPRVAIEPGADELGMALVARALARGAKWTPRVAVRYSKPNGGATQDPLEYAPVSVAIDGLIRLCGGVPADDAADVVLFVRLPKTSAAQDDAFAAAMASEIDAGRSVALADLSFLSAYAEQAAFARRILASGLAARLDAYASWNTNANTVGTALAEAIAAGAGRRTQRYDGLAHRTFTFLRFLDDYAFHDVVRPELNAELDARGIADHTLLDAGVAAELSQETRARLWPYAVDILERLDPGYHIAALSIGLPWDRTFEVRLDAGLAPDIP